jgi:hypothetical protein
MYTELQIVSKKCYRSRDLNICGLYCNFETIFFRDWALSPSLGKKLNLWVPFNIASSYLQIMRDKGFTCQLGPGFLHENRDGAQSPKRRLK